MLTWLKSEWHAFWTSPEAAKRILRGALLFVGVALAPILGAGFDAARGWTFGEWCFRLLGGIIAGIAGTIGVGQMNAPVTK